jgi:hypothetical protein
VTAQDILWWALLGLIFAITKVGEHFTKKLIKTQGEWIEAQRVTIDAQKDLIGTLEGLAQLDKKVQEALVMKLQEGGQL